GGLMAIIDFEPRWWLTMVSRPKGVPANRGGHGMPKELLVKEVTAAGFDLIGIIDRWPRGSYCVVFGRRALQQKLTGWPLKRSFSGSAYETFGLPHQIHLRLGLLQTLVADSHRQGGQVGNS